VAADELVMVVEFSEHGKESLAAYAERGRWSDTSDGGLKLNLSGKPSE
jgi:hypothetical protein